MDLAGISLAALLLTIVVSCVSRVNPGLLAIVLAWIVGNTFGHYAEHEPWIEAILSGEVT